MNADCFAAGIDLAKLTSSTGPWQDADLGVSIACAMGEFQISCDQPLTNISFTSCGESGWFATCPTISTAITEPAGCLLSPDGVAYPYVTSIENAWDDEEEEAEDEEEDDDEEEEDEDFLDDDEDEFDEFEDDDEDDEADAGDDE